jgi:hypothetical protein
MKLSSYEYALEDDGFIRSSHSPQNGAGQSIAGIPFTADPHDLNNPDESARS